MQLGLKNTDSGSDDGAVRCAARHCKLERRQTEMLDLLVLPVLSACFPVI